MQRRAHRTLAHVRHFQGPFGDIIGAVDGIAFQTHILALNAAVEAAREIKRLITSSGEQVERGTQLVASAGQAMDETVSAIQSA